MQATSVPPEPRVAPDQVKGEKEEQRENEIVWNPLKVFSFREFIGALGVFTFALLVVYIFAAEVVVLQDIFPFGPLVPTQIACFLVGTFLLLWYVAFRAEPILRADTPPNLHVFRLSEGARVALAAGAELSAHMFIFFLCDRTTLIPREEKTYSKDLFWSLWVILIGASWYTLQKAKPPPPRVAPPVEKPAVSSPAVAVPVKEVVEPPKILPPIEDFHVAHLQRDQTEEWKGWMQVMFLWYHYFHATDIYNAIRLYIAAYVWMTGFGNFSYYYVRKDFSLARFCKMQWRLNFLVICVMTILNNEYMLYYICMLHTTFTVFIYAGLGIASRVNQTLPGISVKFGALILIAFLMWDIGGVFEWLWSPFKFLVQYNDPDRPGRDTMQEWHFRSHLDHYIWIVGMATAFYHPNCNRLLKALDALPSRLGNSIKAGIILICTSIMYFYTKYIFLLPKAEYNRLHPYTSFIPITCYVILRNILSCFRRYHLHLFEYLGKVTLETYIAQSHIWMASTRLNGPPKVLLRILPAGWPILNFVLISLIYFWISFRLFECTVALRNFYIPQGATSELVRRTILFGVGFASILTFFSYMIRALAGPAVR